MKCPGCQHENREGRRFCAECGASLALACPSCGFSNEPGEKFCGGCGAPLGAQGGAASGSRFSSPQAYTPNHLAERIRTSKAALEGERKQVTVLFADLKGSMELLADRDPEEARKILDPVLEQMIEAVHRYEGTVNQVMGDGIMALFGAPLAHEDHAVRACYAALRMQESVKRYTEGVRRSHGIEVQIRVGLNSGEVVVRAIGSDLHMDYTAVGQTTHLAARMEQLATPGTICLTADTVRLAEGYVEVKPLGPVPIKGLAAPVEVYEATGAGAVRSRLQAAAIGGLTRFVGRDIEVEQLRKAIDLARAGHGQLVAVVGEPGVGKSRLFHEFTHSSRVQKWLTFRVGSVSYGKAMSYLPVIDLLKGYFKLHDRETHRDIREKVTSKLLTLDRALEPTLPALLALVDVPVEDAQWNALDPMQRRHRTLDAIKRLLLRESQLQPLLVVFEDLHWIDSETQALLDIMVDSLAAARVLLLVNYRPEYAHNWGGKTYYSQIRLDALEARDAGELLEALIGQDDSLTPIKTLLASKGGGNPLFLEESIRALLEAKVLVGEPGAFQLIRPVESVQVSATIRTILASRIDRLPPEEKQLLQTAAVIGKDFSFALLETIGQDTVEELRRKLSHLQHAEFLYETTLFPELEYTFKHALTQEVAYSSLLHERRRVLHGLVLDALERLQGDRLLERVEVLAHHAFRAADWPRAARYQYRAGEKALAYAAFSPASEFLARSVEALDHHGEAADGSLRLDVYTELWVTMMETGHATTDQFRTLADKADRLARQLGGEARLAPVRLQYAQFLWARSREDRGLETALQQALEAITLSRPEDLRTRSYARLLAGSLCHDLGRFEAALAEFDEGIALFSTTGPPLGVRGLVLPILANLYAWRADSLAALGKFDHAVDSAKEALLAGRQLTHPSCIMIANSFLGYAFLLRGHVEAALPHFEEALALAEKDGLLHGLIANLHYLAYALTLIGRRDEGQRVLTRAQKTEAHPSFNLNWTKYRAVVASAYLVQGQADRASEELEHGYSLAMAHGARGYLPGLLRLRAEIALRNGLSQSDDATQDLNTGREIARQLEMRPEEARLCLTQALVLNRRGERTRARKQLEQATVLLRGLDMTFWLESARKELGV